MMPLRAGDVVRCLCSGGERLVLDVDRDVTVCSADDFAKARAGAPPAAWCRHALSNVTLLRRPVRLSDRLLPQDPLRWLEPFPERFVVRAESGPGGTWFMLNDGSGWSAQAIAIEFMHVGGIAIDGSLEVHVAVQRYAHYLPAATGGAFVPVPHMHDHSEIARACFGIERFPDLAVLSRATGHLAADIFALGVEAWPLWRTDPEVIATVEAVADHRIGGRISNGRLGRAYVRAWRSDHGGYRTKWMKRALDARAWRKT